MISYQSVNRREILVYLYTRLVIFGVKVLSLFLKFMFADSRTGKVLTPKDLIPFGSLSYRSIYFG